MDVWCCWYGQQLYTTVIKTPRDVVDPKKEKL